jgi:hypothetical protein
LGLNGGQNAFEIAKNIVIPELHSVTVLSQAAISYRVCSRFAMLRAVHFDN